MIEQLEEDENEAQSQSLQRPLSPQSEIQTMPAPTSLMMGPRSPILISRPKSPNMGMGPRSPNLGPGSRSDSPNLVGPYSFPVSQSPELGILEETSPTLVEQGQHSPSPSNSDQNEGEYNIF